MTEKDKASPRQRQIMEKRWENARKACGEGSCHANYRFHVAGCERRAQKVKVTNLNTGETSEATIVHSDFNSVKKILDQHEKQAVRLEPLGEEYWDAFERGEPDARREPIREVLTPAQFDWTGPGNGVAPARPWWKFWGRRG